MADLSKIKVPDGTEYNFKDSTARSGLSDKMDKANPTGTGALSINRKSGTTTGSNSVALGENCTASGSDSFASGYQAQATGSYAHATGYQAKATGGKAHAEGTSTTASGTQSHAEGGNTYAYGNNSHAEGYYTYAGASSNSNHYSHAEGTYTQATGEASHAEGKGTSSSKVTASGEASHAEGYCTKATDSYAHAEGNGTTASGESSHAEGASTTTVGIGAHAEGGNTTASGQCSHAEGYHSVASANDAHAEGSETVAGGISSHTEGDGSVTAGYAAHAEGYYTVASSDHQHVSGKFNVVDTNGTYAEIIGNGTANDARSNARTLDWSGNEVISGGFQCNAMNVSSSSVTLINPEKWRDAIFNCTPDQSAKDRLLSRLTKSGANIQILEYGGYFGGSQNKRIKITVPQSAYGKYLMFIHLEADTTVHDYEIFAVQNAQGTAFSKAHYGRTTPSWTNITGTASTGTLTWGVTGLQIYSSIFAPYGSWYVKIIASDGPASDIPNVYYTNES